MPTQTPALNWPATATGHHHDRARDELTRRANAAGVDLIEGDIAARAAELAEQESGLAAFERGVPHRDDDAYEAIWAGAELGLSHAHVRTQLAHAEVIAELVSSGAVAPVHGVTLGSLRDEIASWKRAIATRGRSLTSNQRAVYSQLQAAPF